MGKRLGQSDDPLLVSVRSGAKFSMPGMMETVLNVGLNDQSVRGLAKQAGDERFAFDSYRRLIQMFGKTVLDIDGEHFEDALEAAKRERGSESDLDLDAGDLRKLVETFKEVVVERAGRPFPQDPREQMDLAVRAVFESWNTDRAVIYRRQERIPSDLGTAVNIVAMVFGNLDMDSGTGVAFTRDPASGAQGIYGDYLQNAQGEDVVAGIRNTVPLAELEQLDKSSYDELLGIMQRLEEHYLDLCDIEFTIERGKLWMLQTRVGKRTAAAAFRIATQLVDQGLIDMDEAISRVTGAQLAQLMFPRFDYASKPKKIATGMNASPGAATGKVVFDSYTAVKWSRSGEKVILVRRETNPDDLNGMIAAAGILTSRGGKTSHAAVVARGMGKTCVCGAEALKVDTKRRVVTAPRGVEIHEGDLISIDGTTGDVFLGEVPVVDSPVVRYFEEGIVDEGTVDEGGDGHHDLVAAVDRIMKHADGVRRMSVRSNSDNPEDSARARRFGAQGIGLCRTEHMFLGARRELVERLILSDTDDERDKELAELLPMQREDFVGILESMDGLPVTIRLLDPPLHEFLPDITELSVRVAVAEARGEEREGDLRMLQAVHRLHEQNPMLGLRGVRLGVVIPGLFEMQSRAILEAAAQRIKDGGVPRVEIMVPLVGQRAGVRDHQARHHHRRPRGAGRDRRPPGIPRRHHDRTAPRGADRRPHRRGGRVLLLRHQRPHPDHVGLFPRRRRGRVLLRLPRERDLRGQPLRIPRRGGRGRVDPYRRREGPLPSPRPQARHLRRTRRRPRLRPLLRTRRPGLRLLLTIPRPRRPPRSRPRRVLICRLRSRPHWSESATLGRSATGAPVKGPSPGGSERAQRRGSEQFGRDRFDVAGLVSDRLF